jgi:hypothetical protein
VPAKKQKKGKKRSKPAKKTADEVFFDSYSVERWDPLTFYMDLGLCVDPLWESMMWNQSSMPCMRYTSGKHEHDISVIPEEHRADWMELSFDLGVLRRHAKDIALSRHEACQRYYCSDGNEEVWDTEESFWADMSEAHRCAEAYRTGKSASAKAYVEVQESLDGHIIMFEDPYDEEKGETPTKKSVLAKNHLLMPKVAGMLAVDLSEQLAYTSRGWRGGSTSLGNALWDRFLFRSVARAKAMLQKHEYQLAMGDILGILLYTNYCNDGWLVQNEVCCYDDDCALFEGFFADLSMCWQRVLRKSDATLGLTRKGYRTKLNTMLKKFSKIVNAILKEQYAGTKARFRLKPRRA